MSGKRLPTGKQWEAGALAAVPVDYASVDYVPKVVTNPDDASAPLLEYTPLAVVGDDIPTTIVDAKGDIIAATAADTVARLAVGTDGQQLIAAAAEATGLKYVRRTFSLAFVFPTGIAAGAVLEVPSPYAGDFAAWWARLDVSGSASFTVKVGSGVTGAASTVGGTAPAVSSALGASNTGGLNWTTIPSVARGDIVQVTLATLTTATRATLTIDITRTGTV